MAAAVSERSTAGRPALARAALDRLGQEDGAALLPGTLCCFPPPDDSDHAGWHRRLATRLGELTRQAADDPMPIRSSFWPSISAGAWTRASSASPFWSS